MSDSPTRLGDGYCFDFDSWAGLAQSDPQAFEARRRALLEEAIERAHPRQRERLRRLQWKLDQIRSLSEHPLGACVKLSDLMWRSVTGPGGLQDALGRLQTAPTVPMPAARVLDFDARKRRS